MWHVVYHIIFYVLGRGVFLSSRGGFSTFVQNCGSDESLGTTTCLESVVGGRQGHAP